MTKRPLTVGSLKIGFPKSFPSQPEKKEVSQETTSVKVIQNESTYQISPQTGKTLLQAALDQNQSLQYKCTKGTCGRCTVKLVAGGDFLTVLNEKEQEKLKGLEMEGYRLACQAVFK